MKALRLLKDDQKNVSWWTNLLLKNLIWNNDRDNSNKNSYLAAKILVRLNFKSNKICKLKFSLSEFDQIEARLCYTIQFLLLFSMKCFSIQTHGGKFVKSMETLETVHSWILFHCNAHSIKNVHMKQTSIQRKFQLAAYVSSSSNPVAACKDS